MESFRQIIPPGFGSTLKVYKILDEYFIMIPKNASNTILYGTAFMPMEVSLSQLSNQEIINIFIREPIDRFKAGFIESLKRCALYNNNNKIISNYSSVPVSGDIRNIYHNVFEKISQNPYEYISKILEIISTDFYDPHLCPQWYFFTNLEKKTLSRIRLHNLSRLNHVMEGFGMPLRKSFNIESSFDTENYISIKSKTSLLKRMVKRNLNKIDSKFIDFYHSIKFFKHSSIKQTDTAFNFIDYKKWVLVSRKIKSVIDNNKDIKDRINDIYHQDKEMFFKVNNKSLYLPFEYLF